MDWISFWDSKHSVYVNGRHLAAHYRRIADDLLPYVPSGGAVLDYGCGEALSHARIGEKAGRLILCDAAPGVRATLGERFSGTATIEVRAPDELAALPAASLDLIVMHSVAQYLTPAQLDNQLAVFRRLLKPDGMLVLGDIIPPNVSPITDALALLQFGAHEGFFVATGFGLVRTLFSNYAKLRTTLGLTHYDQSTITAKLAAAGFTATRAATNVGHNPSRMTLLGRPAS